MVTITLDLDKELESEARSRGLLSSERIAELIASELRQQKRQEAAARLTAAMDVMAAHMREKYGDLSDDEAQVMIDAWIAEADEPDELAGG